MSKRYKNQRRGSVVVLSAILMAILFACLALSVDVGVVSVAQTQLQRSADAAAHAGALEYATPDGTYSRLSRTRMIAHDWVERNPVLSETTTVSHNWFNANGAGDIVLGRYDFDYPSAGLETAGDPDLYNAVRVRIRRNEQRNGDVPLFFARVLGHRTVPLAGQATAVVMRNVRGFRWPPSGYLPILPITIRQDDWEAMMNSHTYDQWEWDPDAEMINPGSDGIPEAFLFPNPGNSAGNFGTVRIGDISNSNAHLTKQVRNGLSQSDLDYHGGELKLNENGELRLGGDTGIDSSLQNDLDSIAGEPRIIPLYKTVMNPGHEAEYVIVKWVGVRLMSVNLTGGAKGVYVQPTNVTLGGMIQGGEGQSDQIYSPPQFVQ